MKVKGKKVILSLAVLVFSTFVLSIDAPAQTTGDKAVPIISYPQKNSGIIVYPDAHIIGWRYKSNGGKVYRRQYNYSRRKWIGEWERC